MIETLITNQLQIAKQLRYQLRTKAASSVRIHSARTLLIDSSIFTPDLFDTAAIAKAKDCYKHASSSVTLKQPALHGQQQGALKQRSAPRATREGFHWAPLHSRGRGSYVQRHQ